MLLPLNTGSLDAVQDKYLKSRIVSSDFCSESITGCKAVVQDKAARDTTENCMTAEDRAAERW